MPFYLPFWNEFPFKTISFILYEPSTSPPQNDRILRRVSFWLQIPWHSAFPFSFWLSFSLGIASVICSYSVYFTKPCRKKCVSIKNNMYICTLKNEHPMVNVVSIASYISERYMKEYGERIDEMKLHKLLYLTQRECMIQTGEPMFDATFHAWKYGPVLPEIRLLYRQDALNKPLSTEDEAK